MAFERNTRRAATTKQELDRLIQAGAYDNAPLNPTGAQTMLDSAGATIGRPAYGTSAGNLQSAYQTDLPANVAGPQLPDMYMTARNSARGDGRDDMSQMIARDQTLYDQNMAIATRRAQGIDPSIQWRPGTDAATFMNDQQSTAQAFTQQPEYSGPPTAAGVTPELMRNKIQERLSQRRGG